MPTQSLQGIGASPGIAMGPVWQYRPQRIVAERTSVADVDGELNRLAAALDLGRNELAQLVEQASASVGANEAAIFEAQRMFLDDPELLDQVLNSIRVQQVNAEYAWQEGTEHYAAALRSIGDDYLAARAADVRDVAQRVLRILQQAAPQTTGLQTPAVIAADDLAPSDTVTLPKSRVLAFCTAQGGPTSHVAILSKALGIPSVVGLGEGIVHLQNGIPVIVDGANGRVLVEPDPAIVHDYQQRAEAIQREREAALALAVRPAITTDGKQIEIVANVGSVQEAMEALASGAEGIGLLRTEFLYLERADPPDENEQIEIYRAILETMGQRPVVVRTLDIGGDKPASYLKMPVELNPFLGVRGIRLTLDKPEVFQTQLRALLIAGEGHKLKIMFPMVATLEEVRQARQQFEQARATLETRGVSYARHVEIGIMVEVPSAALIAPTLAEVVDFFSIGTNDLSQYTLAADRTNAAVAPIADALHPAVLKLIRMVIEAAHAHGRWVGLCGELAGDPLATPVLLGLGLDEFSVVHRSIPLIKQAIRRYSMSQAREIAERALAQPTAGRVREYLSSVAA